MGGNLSYEASAFERHNFIKIAFAEDNVKKSWIEKRTPDNTGALFMKRELE